MLTALLTGLAGTAIGAVLGIWTRRTLATLNYRLDNEQDLPIPGRRRWITWTSAFGLGSITAWLATTDTWPLAPVLLPLTLAGPALAAIDLDVMRLPNRILAPVAAATLLGLTSTTITEGGWSTLLSGLAGSLITGATFWALHVLSRGGIGLGDVKLAAVIGIGAGAIGIGTAWWSLLVGTLAAFIWATATRHRGPFPFGPWLLSGALAAVVDPVAVIEGLLRA